MKLLKKDLSITIDGPAAAGKSVLAERVGDALKLRVFSSGVLFRALAYSLIQERKTDDLSKETLSNLLSNHTYQLVVGRWSRKMAVSVDGRCLENELGTPEVAQAASFLGELPLCQIWVKKELSPFLLAGGLVLEGRNAGSYYYPEADVKIFLTARLDVRAQRRESESLLLSRDLRDIERDNSPLRVPPEAFVIDSSDLNEKQVLAVVLDHIEEKGYLVE